MTLGKAGRIPRHVIESPAAIASGYASARPPARPNGPANLVLTIEPRRSQVNGSCRALPIPVSSLEKGADVTDVPTMPRSQTRMIVLALLLDIVLVVGFAALGRASHDSDIFGGLWRTAWPFLISLGIGWLVTMAWRAPLAPVRTGLGVWAATVVGGMLLRAASGQGTALPFIIVATTTMLLLLVGWRLIAALIVRLRARRD